MTMASEAQYHALLYRILSEGHAKDDRTGTGGFNLQRGTWR